MKYIRVTMSNGDKYDIPAWVVARSRAKYYSEKEGDGIYGKIYNEEYSYTMENTYELTDWLSCNMNWNDVKSMSIKIESKILTEKDLQEGIINGEKEIIER